MSTKQKCLNCESSFESSLTGFCDKCSKLKPEDTRNHLYTFSHLSIFPFTYELCINLHKSIGLKPPIPSKFIQHIFRNENSCKKKFQIIIVYFDVTFRIIHFKSNDINDIDRQVAAFIARFYGAKWKDPDFVRNESKNFIYK